MSNFNRTNAERIRQTQAVVEAIGRRYCTNCQSTRTAEGGAMRGPRWMCAACVHRRKHRINTGTNETRKEEQ